MAIPIEKNVPYPGRPGPQRELSVSFTPSAADVVPELARMQPGDSIYIPNTKNAAFPPVGAVRVHAYGTQTGRKFACQYDDEGMRVWRVS